MWKRLLVGVDGSQAAQAAERAAFFLARLYDAEVEALFVADARLAAPPLLPADMLGAPLEVPEAPFRAIEDEERRRGEALLEAVRGRAAAAGVRASTRCETGIPARAILARLKSADAVVLGRRGRAGAPLASPESPARVGALGTTLRTVGREAVRPVFVACDSFERVSRVMVAYDGSPEAMRAVRVACELSDRGRAGLAYGIVTVDDDPAAAEGVQAEAATFFAGHGLAPERVFRKGPAAAEICGAARAFGADLLVAGSFGKSRLGELLLGSVTSDLLRCCEVSLLIHH